MEQCVFVAFIESNVGEWSFYDAGANSPNLSAGGETRSQFFLWDQEQSAVTVVPPTAA